MAERASLQAGTHSLHAAHGWLRLNTWKAGMLAAMGHDLLLDLKGFELQLQVNDGDDAVGIELSIPKGQFEVLAPGDMKDKDRAEISKNIQKHLPSDLRFSGSAQWTSAGSLQVAGNISLGKSQTPITFPAQSDGTRISGKVRLSHEALGIKPFRAPLGVIKIKDELDFSFQLEISSLLATS